MIDYIIIGIVLVIAGLSAWYIISQKKKGAKCIGCPSSKSCSGNCSSCGHCDCGK
ncbi:MAG: FeoB-associated Cys-rich membrane protein [Oscillospiraceae bacterium]|nr:FeoB-associated Cys-rich membrane protein [Oscillospiraceae bacterium]